VGEFRRIIPSLSICPDYIALVYMLLPPSPAVERSEWDSGHAPCRWGIIPAGVNLSTPRGFAPPSYASRSSGAARRSRRPQRRPLRSRCRLALAQWDGAVAIDHTGHQEHAPASGGGAIQQDVQRGVRRMLQHRASKWQPDRLRCDRTVLDPAPKAVIRLSFLRPRIGACSLSARIGRAGSPRSHRSGASRSSSAVPNGCWPVYHLRQQLLTECV
jgi:hypothetical protein